MSHFVYKYVVNNQIIYIGKCDAKLERRIYEHSMEGKFKPYLNSCQIFYTKLLNKTMSDVVESELIRRYKPILNVAKMSDWAGLDFPELLWELYISAPHKLPNKIANKKSSTTAIKQRKLKLSTKIKETVCNKEKYKNSVYYINEILNSVSSANYTEDMNNYYFTFPLLSWSYNICCIDIWFTGPDSYGRSSLGNIIINKKRNSITFKFFKENINEQFEEISIPPGLSPRLQYVQQKYTEHITDLEQKIKQMQYELSQMES